ncbi:helix-turn-helix domain-containing protein [Agrobacterium tumefaciens]|uniref:helix-turn-helix domain-containing protein n=1 Tax=Agrobacterium tumefaciens TaxID=358 RepID=UPI00157174B9|nr:helix-turn-helix domain-containing protein [Agrobacterium tumefaciens]NSZ61866.1 helix-turn-helix domain-containing protein [Agrobacterium tumefaciens]NTA68238.1 helix-turn-helix domain-containing protein [Agrobacterium tumefaciens]WIE38076.1 helix-turn-helix domain-containing protein [Agrobacterium tumefaciens]
MADEGPGRVLTPARLADRWHCSERHVRNMLVKGELPFFKLGRKLIRIKIEDVENYEAKGGSSSKSER